MSLVNERQIGLKTGGNFSLLKDYLDKRTVKVTPFQEITLTLSAVSFQELPAATWPGFLAVGAATTETDGSIMTGIGLWAIGTPAFSAVTAVDTIGNVLNLVDVRDATSHDPVYDTDGRKVYGLITSGATSADGDAVGATGVTANLEVSFVKNDGTGTFSAVTLTGTYEIQLNKVYQARFDKTIELQGGAKEVDVIADITVNYLAQYTVDNAAVTGKNLTLSTGVIGPGGIGSSVPSGDYAAIAAWFDAAGKFNGNTFIVQLNGVEQVKGSGLDVEYVSSDTMLLNFAVDVGDVITIKAIF